MYHHLKALRYDLCVTRGSYSFTCHPHTNQTCLYSLATRHHRPLAGTNLYCLMTEAHSCEKLSQSFYTACARPRLEPTLPTAPRRHLKVFTNIRSVILCKVHKQTGSQTDKRQALYNLLARGKLYSLLMELNNS